MLNNCKFYKEKKQVSYDFGVTWLDTGDYRKGNLYEYQSADCPIEFDGKWLAEYSDSHTESAQCDSSSAITSGEITKTDLVEVMIGDCVTSIGGSAFASCSSLTSVTIPDSVTSINDYAFMQCSSLTSITIPDNVTTIGSFAFYKCISLTTCTIGSSVTSIGASAFRQCSSLTSVTIPDSTTSINAYAFNDCSGLTSIDIPSGVTIIGNQAFLNCSGLTSITINSVSPPTMQGSGAFNNTNDCPIYVPSGSLSAYQSAWSSYASRIQAIP